MRALRVAGVVFKQLDQQVEVETAHRGLGYRGICVPDSNRRITPAQARRIVLWFEELAQELAK